MCWWRTKVVCAAVVVLLILGAWARGESILQLHRSPEPIAAQWPLEPTPMAPSAMELVGAQAVPAPKSLWAGLAMMAALGICRWFSARRTVDIQGFKFSHRDGR